jgi:glycosyltransferase involved in cell wall biosynthesis
MADEFDCDFYFGDTVFQKIRKFEELDLPGYQGTLKAKRTHIKGFIWHSGMLQVLKWKYTHYIITGDSYSFLNWIIIYYCVITGKKVYLWGHGLHEPVKGYFNRLFHKAFYRNASGIFLYGEYALPYMKDIGCRENKLYIIHNSLDTEKLESLYVETGSTNVYRNFFGNSNPVLLYIGRIQKRKKLDLLLFAMDRIKKNGKVVNLVVIGNNEDDDGIMSLSEKLNLSENIWFYGECFDEKRNAELIFNADVCVCPAEVGLTCIHSLSFGTPVITNDDYSRQMPEFEAIIPGETGGFYKTDDINDLARIILQWVDKNILEREHVRTIARNTIREQWSVTYQIDVFKKALYSK